MDRGNYLENVLLPVDDGFVERPRCPFQVFFEAQLKSLADGGDDVLRQPTPAFQDVTGTAMDMILGHVSDKIQRILLNE